MTGLGFLLLQLMARCRIPVDGKRRSSIYVYISVVNAYQKCPPHPRKRLRAERNSAHFSLCPFPRAAALEHAIRRISDKFPTSETSQNISKMTCFSHAAKTRKKFSSLDSSKKSSVGWIVSSNAQSNEIPTKLQQNCNTHPTSQTSQT